MARPGTLRVKTGCVTCRLRKVKCDEQKPSCRRCLSTGRQCDGYKTPSAVHGGQGTQGSSTVVAARSGNVPYTSVDRAEPSSAHVHLGDPRGPPGRNDMSTSDAQAIDFYRVVVSKHLQLGSGKKGVFWGQTVLQAAQQYTAPRHAIIALSHSYRKQTWGSVLSHYNKAIRELTLPRQDINVTLLVSLVFCCLEAFRGNDEDSARHFRHGWSILDTDVTAQAQQDLSAEFFRIDYYKFFFGGDGRDYPSFNHYRIEVERPFASWGDAQFQLDQILSRVCRLARKTNVERVPPLAVKLMRNERARLNKLLTLWEDAYSTYRSSSATTDVVRPDSYATLRITFLIAKLLANTPLHDGEMAYDKHNRRFEEAVDLVSAVNNLGPEAEVSPTFGMETILFMSFVATKCRLLRVRLAALQAMLDSSEGRNRLKVPHIGNYYAGARRCAEIEHGIDLSQHESTSSLLVDNSVVPVERRVSVTTYTSETVTGVDTDGQTRIYKKAQFVLGNKWATTPGNTITSWLTMDSPWAFR